MDKNKIIHLLASVVLFGIPLILASHSPALDVTLGGVLNAIYLFISQKINPTTPVK